MVSGRLLTKEGASLLGKLRRLLAGSSVGARGIPQGAASEPQSPPHLRRHEEKTYSRHSNGLDQFITAIRDLEPISILDLSGVSQANISFITSLGHRLYFDDFMQTLEQNFGAGNFYENQANPQLMDGFLGQTLNYQDSSFQAALIWDNLEYLTQPLLGAVVDRLYRILTPGAVLLAFFHADEHVADIPAYSYRIVDQATLSLASRGRRRPAQFYNSRGLERLFQRFDTKKFFLTRDHLREVIVRK